MLNKYVESVIDSLLDRGLTPPGDAYTTRYRFWDFGWTLSSSPVFHISDFAPG